MHAYVARATEIGRVLKNSVDKSCSVDIFFFLFFFSLSDYSNVITYEIMKIVTTRIGIFVYL